MRRACLRTMILLGLLVACSCRPLLATDAPSEFAKPTIDLGLVASDAAKSVKFYTDGLGFKELKGFKVAAEYAQEVGLTSAELDIHVLALGEGETGTRLKIMQIDLPKSKADTAFIHSQTGFRYLTVYVTDTTATMARLEKAGIQPIGKTPSEIPASVAPGHIFLTIVRDPDGNMIELVGPKK